jgi:ubiquinone/menaquinone biosynthesis C-methylase UbiE
MGMVWHALKLRNHGGRHLSGYEPPASEVWITALLTKTVLSAYYARYVGSLGLRGSEQVLDYGSGTGVAARHIAARLAKGGGHLTCVDVSERWMQVAQRTTRDYTNVEYRLGHIATLGIEDDTCDVVFVHFVLHDIPRVERTESVCHLARKLREGGKLFAREPTSGGHGMSPDELSQLMAGAGLQQVSLKTGKLLRLQSICDGEYRKTATR